jgi:hypothetical protein
VTKPAFSPDQDTAGRSPEEREADYSWALKLGTPVTFKFGMYRAASHGVLPFSPRVGANSFATSSPPVGANSFATDDTREGDRE